MSSTLSRHMKPQHLKATKAFGYAVTLGDFAGWSAASALFAVHLRPREIASLSIAALGALDDDAYAAVLAFMEGEA